MQKLQKLNVNRCELNGPKAAAAGFCLTDVALHARDKRRHSMPILLWLLGVPIPVIIILLLLWH